MKAEDAINDSFVPQGNPAHSSLDSALKNNRHIKKETTLYVSERH